MVKLGAVLLAAALLVVGCGDDDSGDGGDGGGGAGSNLPPVIDVETAGDHDRELVVAEGFLVLAPEAVHRLCAALAESYPPQCSGERVEIVGLELGRVAGTTTNDELPEGERTVWTDAPVLLTGTVDGTRLELVDATTDVGPAVVAEALAGPTCPVETDPPDPACAARPVAGADLELWGEDDSVVSATTDALGVAVFLVEPGSYQVVPLPVEGLSAPEATGVTVRNGTASVQLAYDTGIR